MAFGDHRSGAPVVQGVVEYLLQRGALVSVSDSQAMGTFQKALKESGLRDALKGLNVQFREFRESIKVAENPSTESRSQGTSWRPMPWSTCRN